MHVSDDNDNFITAIIAQLSVMDMKGEQWSAPFRMPRPHIEWGKMSSEGSLVPFISLEQEN